VFTFGTLREIIRLLDELRVAGFLINLPGYFNDRELDISRIFVSSLNQPL